MSPTQAMIEPPLSPPIPDTDTVPRIEAHPSSVNGEEETALARLADDGGPLPASESQAAETPLPKQHKTDEPPIAPPLTDLTHTLSLEQRVRRLEEALALLREQRTIETRNSSPPAATHLPDPPPVAKPAPVAAAVPASTAILLDVGKRLLGAAAQVVPPTPVSVPNVVHSANRGGILWLLWDTWAEARVIVRMFVDPRYSLPWTARVLPLLMLAAILTSKYWIPGSSIPILGDWLLVKLINLLLAFVLFKWLGHEARRYRRTSPDLPPSLRL